MRLTVLVSVVALGLGLSAAEGVAPRAVRQVSVAAANSRPEAKAAADYVCTGTNDERVIQAAIDDCAKTGRQLFFFCGFYRLDEVRDFGDGGPWAAVCIRNMHRQFSMVGETSPKGSALKGRSVCLYLRPEALPADGRSVDILRGEWSERGILNGSVLWLENMAIWAPDPQHALRALDLQRVMSCELHNISLSAMGSALLKGAKYPYGIKKAPILDNIGITLTDGSNNVPVNLVNVSAGGFGQGFQVGGEHVVMVNCAATFGLYGYTFGNYPYHCAFNHPITMINCCDEQNVNMPLFVSCGDDDGRGGHKHGRQEVTMISFNFERVARHVPGGKLGDLMREVRPGTWRGQIGFTTQPEWCEINSVDLPIWAEDGSGTGFRTVNNAHRPACGTAERRSYYPTYMQQVYDTDLDRLLICTDPAKRVWRDALGHVVD